MPQESNSLFRTIREIRRRGITSAKILADADRVHSSTMGRYLTALEDLGLIARDQAVKVDQGRSIRLHPEAGTLVGLDVTRDRTVAVASDLEYGILTAVREKEVALNEPEGALDALTDMVDDQLGMLENPTGVLGVGIAIAAPVLREGGTPASDNPPPGWKGIPIAHRIEQRLESRGRRGIRVTVGNDASLGALGVLSRARWANPTSVPTDLIYVRVTHGVGMGLVQKGRLVTGAAGLAGEIGHVRVEADGPICLRCNRKGCLEVMSSERAVLERVRMHAAAEGREVPRTIHEVLDDESDWTTDAIGRAGWSLGFVLASACNVLNPTWMVIGGRMAEHPAFFEAVKETLESYALDFIQAPPFRVLSWKQMPAAWNYAHAPGGRDLGDAFSPELLGALAFAVDELGDEYLKTRLTSA